MIKAQLIFIHYYFDPIAWLIQLFTHSFWNHVGWVYNNQIIESKRDGIIISPISKYNHKWLYKTKILMLQNYTLEKQKIIETYLLQQVTTKTSYFCHFKTFLGVILKRPSFITKKTCSGLIAHALAKAGYIFSLKPLDFITPQDIYRALEDNNAS
jgi:hypothetical protein